MDKVKKAVFYFMVFSVLMGYEKSYEDDHKKMMGKYQFQKKAKVANLLFFSLGSYIGWKIGKNKICNNKHKWNPDTEKKLYSASDLQVNVKQIKDLKSQGLINKKQLNTIQRKLKNRVGARGSSRTLAKIDVFCSNVEALYMMKKTGDLSEKEYKKQVRKMASRL